MREVSKVFHLNCKVLNSPFKFSNEICDLSFSQVIGLTETWLIAHNLAILKIPGYKLYNRNRQIRLHGRKDEYIRSNIEA